MSIFRNAANAISRRDFGGPWGDPAWYDPNRVPPNSLGGGGWVYLPVSERVALRQITVWACVSLLSDTIASMPLGAFKQRNEARIPVATPRLLTDPYDDMDITEWLGQIVTSLKLRGNAYGLIIDRDAQMYPTQIKPLHPDDCHVSRDVDTGRIVYKVRGMEVPVPKVDMMHIKGFTVPGSLAGLSQIEYAARSIGFSIATEDYGGRYFFEAANPSSVVETDAEMTPDAAKALQATWLKQHKGRRLPAVLSGGLKYKPISLSPNESQFLETRKMNSTDICKLYRVPPHMVGELDKTTSWGTGMEEQSFGFATYTLGIDLVRIENQMTKYLPRGQYAKFNLNALLRGKLLDRYNSYLIGRNAGFLSADDIRALEEMAPLPDGKGQNYTQPLNIGTVLPGGNVVSPGVDPAAATEPNQGGFVE